MQPWHSDNPALTRAFAPVFDERDDANLPIEGDLPAGLSGVFMRNGPNPQFEPGPGYAYPYDGAGMIHALYLDSGRARYRKCGRNGGLDTIARRYRLPSFPRRREPGDFRPRRCRHR